MLQRINFMIFLPYLFFSTMQFSKYNFIHLKYSFKVVGLNGLEPSTSRLSGVRSNQLSYKPTMVEVKRFELLTPCVQGRCSPN